MNRSELAPFVSRLVLEWAADSPDARYRRVDGTLVFTDLSGFTAMSERLSRLGKLGAEELTVHLDATFSEMLRVAYHRGGSLLKFGGDALLVFFWGDDHARRGVAAAQEMRAKLREVGKITTEAGKFRLRMSVGVHSGEFDLFLVGGSHRELVVTGEAATTTVEMEGAADANEILLSAATAALLPPSCLGDPKGDTGACLLRRKPRVGDARWESPVPTDDVDPTPFVSYGLRERLSDPQRDAEHRQVTVTFIHFVGVAAVIAESGPDEAARRIEALVSFAQERFDEAGIAFLNIDIYDDGGKIFAQAGAPIAHENDDERMLRAVRAIADEDFGLTVRIGVNRGYVFVGEIGTEYGRTYTAMGDAVNTAARVMAKAEPGQVLSTAAVLDRSNTAFETTQLPPFAAKGKKEPLIAFDVGQISMAPVQRRHDEVPLIGRADEQAALVEAFRGAKEGRGATIEVVGEPGMGKSRLVHETVDAVDGIDHIWIKADPYAQESPYAVAGELIRRALALDATTERASEELHRAVSDHAPSLLPWLPLIAVPLGIEVASTSEVEDLDERFVRDRMHEVILELMSSVITTPTAIVIDDRQWLDDASTAMLQRLAQAIGERPWVLCSLHRPSGVPALADGSTIVDVRPLSVEACADLARAVLPGELLPDQLEAVIERSGGNPLFLTELLRRHGGDGTALPETVDQLFMARLDQLDAADRRLLRFASVSGMAVDPALLSAVTGGSLPPPEAWGSLSQFLTASSDGTIRFRQALLRDVAYNSMPYVRRRDLHRRFAQVIEMSDERDDQVDRLSLHYHEAREWDRSWQYSKTAAQRARQRFATVEAIAFYQRAVKAGRMLGDVEPTELRDLHRDLGVVAFYGGHHEQAERSWKKALALNAAGASGTAETLYLLGELARGRGDNTAALRRYQQVLRDLDQPADLDQHRWRSRALNACADIRRLQGKVGKAVTLAEASEREADAAGDEPGKAMAHATLFAVLTASGDHAGAAAYEALPLRVFTETGALWHLTSFQMSRGVAAHYRGRWRDAERLYSEASNTAAAIGCVSDQAIAANNRGEILSDQGRWAEAAESFAVAEQIWLPATHRLNQSVLRANQGRLLARQQNPDGERVLSEAKDELRSLGVRGYALLAEAWVAEARALRGADLDLLPMLDRCEAEAAVLDESLSALLARTRALVLAHTGDLTGARACLEVSVRCAMRHDLGYETVATVDVWRRLGSKMTGPPADVVAVADEWRGTLGIVCLPPVGFLAEDTREDRVRIDV